MDRQIDQRAGCAAWTLAKRQHGVITRRQLLELGFGKDAIKHRVSRGRLHPVASGVYAVGRPLLTQRGRWMAAVLSCGSGAVLSHHSAATLWEIFVVTTSATHVSVPAGAKRRRPGVVVHRRGALASEETTHRDGVPVTTPLCTLIDLAACVDRSHIETAINAADRLDLIAPEQIRRGLFEVARRPGIAALREILDRRTFVLTDSELERRFLPLVREAGLSRPETGHHVNGFKVDFFWPELGLVVETDGLRYHRTPAQQTRDRLRDQVHTAAGLTSIRFTHAQVRDEREHVRVILRQVARQLRASG
jgi:very-short-patch-repair endonuclease/predicted transcriptional regulator of viral defense system